MYCLERRRGFRAWNSIDRANVLKNKQNFRWELLEQTPYSLNLAPSDYCLFQPLKKHRESRHFRTPVKVKEAVLGESLYLEANFCLLRFQYVCVPTEQILR
ncbi:hypothetical protein TNCV_1421171 [Trichonephila clavipes]|nr:hypothetical protein TNCV_1421171 [Trichonephila clavipes]